MRISSIIEGGINLLTDGKDIFIVNFYDDMTDTLFKSVPAMIAFYKTTFEGNRDEESLC